ncbi:terminase large subunit [Roseomonas eburnea]|uniref:Terminase large subunit n=1 Tax=Neoroseomonas eburnea TaxID=1346889 RepID=A0A9X9X6W1_9PROT|nr:terminase large subunit [Neoroseomonas eburnea]
MTAWSLACPDWAARIQAGQSLLPEMPLLLRAEAERAVTIFNRLRLPDVPGRPPLSTAGGDWQRDIVRALFGSWDGTERHIREIFALVPKKNAKTTAGAAIMVTALLMNRRPRAEFIIVAPTQDVSDLAYRQAVGMIEADPVLAAKFHVQEHLKRITYRPTNAFLKVKSFDPKIVTGTKPAGILLDELHVIAEAPDADRVIGQIRGGLISQPEGFLITITTQSERPPAGVFRAELMKARKVRDGVLQAPILPVLYEFPPEVEWRDPANWKMVTPNDGRSITVQRLVPDYHAAVEAGEEELRRWASQHLNVEIGLALLSDAWAGAEHWEPQADPDLTLNQLLRRADVVTVGIDGGGLDDLLGLSVIGRDAITRDWLLWSRAWAHPIVLERRKSEAARMQDFARDGDLRIVARLGDDVEEVADLVADIDRAGLLHAVGLDPVGIGGIVDALAERHITGDRVVGIPQGWRISGAIKTLERKLADGTLRHPGQALMAWCVGNARVEPRGNAVTITKQAAGKAKIDPLVAAFNAAELMSRNPEARSAPSIFLI